MAVLCIYSKPHFILHHKIIMEEKNSLKTVTHITKITYTIFVLKYYNYINQNVNSLLNMRICGICVPRKGFFGHLLFTFW